ncbi:hypothetical protein OQA88_7922 [Cercophora sp. LCS_1]
MDRRIAIIGMACRLPGGADSPQSLWSMLASSRDGFTEVPRSRWDWKAFYHKNPDQKEATNFSHAYFLQDDVSKFDARFFGIPSAEATGVDPQQRLVLEVAYEAIEDAGIPVESLRGSATSVHMATFARDYDRMGYKDGQQLHKTHIIGSGDAILSNRISYLLDLKGTSNTLDTGCLLLSPDQSIAMSQLTNTDGRCYTFDDRGAGYARGEGLGVLVLKRLDQAVADGDMIHAVIVESGSNHDGKTSGIFLPNPDAQEALARSVYAKAGLDPTETLFVESHGTGTQAGDSAEISSIAKVFGREAGRRTELPVGSVKSNIGHLEAASGVASLVKAIMVLKQNQIPPQLNFINPKPSLHLEERGIKVPLELTPLAPEGHTGPRRVSVNSFGYGGTNAHAILEAYDAPTANGHANGHANGYTNGANGVNGHANGHTIGVNGHSHPNGIHGHTNGHTIGTNGTNGINGHAKLPKDSLITLSANSEASLTIMITNLRRWLSTPAGESTPFTDLAYTLNVRRSKLPWRCSVVATSSQDLEVALSDPKLKPIKSSRDVALSFVFTGQGAQWFAMGRELLSTLGVFAASIGDSNRIMKSLGCEWDLVEELSRDKTSSRIGEARFSQPCTTAVQIALVDLLETYGISPEAVCGHSSGEVAAAYAVGALSRESAMRVAYMRGIYSFEAKGLNKTAGGMLAAGEGEEAILKRIAQLNPEHGKVTVACVNSPESTTISGDVDAILELSQVLDIAGVFNRRLQVDSAYHSHHMEVVAQAYLASLEGMEHGAPRDGVAFFSSVVGARKEADFGPAYWVSNLVSQVKFSAAAQLVAEHASAAYTTANNVVIEVGPHAALAGPLRQSLSNFRLSSGASFKYEYIPCLVRNESAVRTVLALAGKVFESGALLQFNGVSPRGKVISGLPKYPWDHSTTYWHESRLSKSYRQRHFPYHDLLGLFDVQSSPYEPRWRYHANLEATPWLRDHVVENFVIFPGVGYLIMAIEAVKQLQHIRKLLGTIKNVNFRNVTFDKPVVVHDIGAKGSREVEMQLVITPSRQHTGTPWENFRVLSYDVQDDLWVDNCSGLVSWDTVTGEVQQPQTGEGIVGARDDGLGHLTAAAADEWLKRIKSNCPNPVDVIQEYTSMTASGNEYGPCFQGMKEISVGKNSGFAKIVIEDIESQMPGHYQQPHTIHPTSFDSIIQLESVVFRRECTAAPMMPVLLGDVSVAVDMDSTPGTEIFVALELYPESKREATANFCAYQKLSDGTFRPVVTGSEIRPQAVGDADGDAAEKKLTYRMEWKPDPNYITQEDFLQHVSSKKLFDVDFGPVSDEPAEAQLRLNEIVASIFVRRTVQRLRAEGITTAHNSHLTKLLNWMLKWDTSEGARFLEGVTSDDEAKFIENAKSNIVGLTLARLGPQYLELFAGKADALELLVQDDLLGRLYREYTLFKCHYAQMGEYVQTLVHKDPFLKFLEIGAGTGGATFKLMERMQRDDRLLVENYTYTDISAGFFETARERFSKWTSQIDFKTLDISRDPLQQGYAAHSFDVIVASIVLHATPLMDITMANVRKLLKPGGRLILMELTAVAAAQNAIFGTLEGWWMSEDGRRDGPLLTVPEWDDCLKRHGFSGTDLAIPAQNGWSSDVSTVIVARAVETEASKGIARTATIHLGHSDEAQVAIAEKIRLSLGQHRIDAKQENWSLTPTADTNSLAIVVDSAEHPLLFDPSEESFEHVKQLLLQGKNVLWVSFQCSPPTGETAAFKNMVNGSARVIRRENPGLRLITVDVQDQVYPSKDAVLEHIVQTLAQIAESSFWDPEATRAEELEYAIQEGKLAIPRVLPDDRFAQYVDSRNPEQDKGESALVECKYLDQSRPLMFDVQFPGLLNTMRFTDNDKMAEPLGADEVEIQARAYGVNFKDVFLALGQMAPGTEGTGEVAGVITAVGSSVQNLKPGDRVIALMVTPFGNQVRIHNNGVVAIPDSLSFSDAASLPIVYYTAWYSLMHVARLEKGQTVLIHAASGGVGQAAIQLATMAGAEIYATVGSASKKKVIQEQYGIPDDHIFSSHSRHFKKHILNATGGKGVDVVLNSLSGQLLMDSWDCVARFGTFVEIGKADIFGRSQLNMSNFDKHVTFSAVDISYIIRGRPEQLTRGLREIYSMVDQGLLKPVYPVTTFPMTRIEDTFRLIAARKHVGKLVLVADEETVVQATRPKAAPLRLRRDGTYVIGGGLGDLGKRMGCFLAEKGAGHIVALTRRKLDAEKRALLEEAVSKLGGTLHIVQCDIGDEASTRAAAEEIASLPPVRGVIQSALVLCDHPLEYMELADWKTAVNPKVQGTLNMHKAFCSPETTDFFVMLSSVASMIGSGSQSNYAAGNAFQDAFAKSQRQYSQGITQYTTINVGAVEGSEQIARALDQNSEIMRIIGSVSFDDVFTTLEYAMGPQARADGATQCLMHFNRDLMEDAVGPSALSDHMYDHVPSKRRLGDKTTANAADSKKQSAGQAVEQAETVAEAEEIVKLALVEKFAAFIGDDIPDDQPVASLGLDSLVSIELKNWVKRTFQIPLQTSELSGAQSIIALAKLIVSRMELMCKASGTASVTEEDAAAATNGATNGSTNGDTNGHTNGTSNGKTGHGLECCKLHKEVPAQPLPDLDDTLDYWLEANEHLYDGQQLESIRQDIAAVRAPDSPARQILQGMYKRHGHDKTNGWFTDIVTEARFLCARGPIAPYANIMGGHRDPKTPHSQAERAAIITSAVVSFKHAMDAGEVEPLELAGKPECTSRWGWLFNSTRVPQLKCDKMVSYSSSVVRNHVAVLRKGRIFKVMLQDVEGKDASLHQLETIFGAIAEQVQGDELWSGILTTDNRDSWAEIRETLSALSPTNQEYFNVIDSAMFVLCLDATNPITPEDMARQGYIGDGANRWFDKVLQFWVSENGRSGQITEHGVVDGTTPARLMEWITKGLESFSATGNGNGHANGNGASSVTLEEVALQTTPEIESHMNVLRKRFRTSTSASSYVREQLDEFGTDFLIESRAPVKSVIDLTFQLAVRLYFGKNMLSWEPMSAAHFHTGRADALQRATPAANAFCDAAAAEESVDNAQLRALLLAAAKQASVGMQTMLTGRSYLRVFEVLSYLWPADASVPKPKFLSDMIFFGRPFPPIYAQTNGIDSDIIVDDFVHLMPDTDGFWSIIVPEKNKIRVSLTGGAGRTDAFVEELHRAARIMRAVVAAV